MMKRVGVVFSDSAYTQLEAIAESRGLTVTDVIREAINLEKWLEDTLRSGARVLTERDGLCREVVWIRRGDL